MLKGGKLSFPPFLFFALRRLQSECFDEALGIEVFVEELDDVLVFFDVVELELGVGETFVERHIRIGGSLADGDVTVNGSLLENAIFNKIIG